MNFTYILNLLFIPSSVLNLYFDNNNTVAERVTNIRVNDDSLVFSEFFNYYYDNYYLRKNDDDNYLKNDDKYLENNDNYIEVDNFFYYFIQN
jgi:hypothetical protein